MEHSCIQSGEIGIIKQQIKTLSESVREQKGLIKTITDMTIDIHDLAIEMKTVRSDIGEVRKDVSDLKAKPAKRWNDIVDTVIKFIAGGFVAYILTKTGLG